MIALPDVDASQAILVGVHEYQVLEDLPAVERNLIGLRDVFTNPALWGLREGHCTLLSQPDSARTVLDTLRDVAARATDTLVIYYAGHGLIDPYTDELWLALPDSDHERLYTALPYEYLRRQVLDPDVPALRKVMILDCCYSGRALIGGMSATTQVADQAAVDGTYLLTASAETRKAVAPPGETFTAFTGELISTLSSGIPNGPELLDMETVYRHLHKQLVARSRPVPQQRNRNAGGLIALVRNAAHASHDASHDAAPSTGHPLRDNSMDAAVDEEIGPAADAAESAASPGSTPPSQPSHTQPQSQPHPAGKAPYQHTDGPGQRGSAEQQPTGQTWRQPISWGKPTFPQPSPLTTQPTSWHRPPFPWGSHGSSLHAGPRTPATIIVGSVMTYLGATLLALMGASMLVVSSIPEAVADFASADPEVRKIPIDTVKTVLRTMGIYSLVVGVALCGLATYAQRGRNWARIALTITGLLQVIIPGVVDLGSPQTVSASGVLYVLYVLYVAIAVILFWNRSAQSWYRTQKVVE